MAGLVPGVGEIADLTNAFLFSIEGNWQDAAISLAALVPVGGQAATSSRLLRQAREALGQTGIGNHAHHILPVKFQPVFMERWGIDINDPRFGKFVDPTQQLKTAYADNMEWEKWLGANPNASFEDVMRQAQKMMDDFGLD
jgi:hypothetical protein